MAESVTFRPSSDQDLEFLYQVYASTRQEELKLTPWNQQEKEEFLQMQFTAQHKHYHEQYRDASYDIILFRNEQIGRLYVDRREDEIRIVDIALLPKYRGHGIGSGIMSGILDDARQAGMSVTIHVERNNPAMHLYERLGFQKLEDVGVYYLMVWSPDSPSGLSHG